VIGTASAFGLGGRHALGRRPTLPETDPDKVPDDAPTVRFYGPEWNALIETAVLDPIPPVQDVRTQALDVALNRDSTSPTEIPLDPTDPAALRRLLDSLRRWNPHPPKHGKG
jgi:hypothetical protein